MIRNISKNNSLWAIVFLGMKSGANFFLEPYIIRYVGIEEYGYVSLAYNMIIYIDIISVAFNYFAGRNIAVEYHRLNLFAANQYYSTVMFSDIALVILLGLPCLLIIYHLNSVIIVSTQYIFDVKVLFFLVLVRYFFLLFSSVLDVGAFVKNRLDLTNKNKILAFSFYCAIVMISFKLYTAHIWYVGFAAVIESLVYFFLQFLTKSRMVPDLVFSIKKFSLTKVVYFLEKGVWIAFNSLGNILNDGLDLLLTNLMISEEIVGKIAIAKIVGNVGYSIVLAVSNSLRPMQLEEYSKGNVNGLVKKLHYSMNVNGWIFCFFVGWFIGCGADFLKLWLNDNGDQTLYGFTLIAISAFMITSVVTPLYYVFVLAQRVRVASIITICMGMINVLSMYCLLMRTTLGGIVVLGTTSVLNLIHIIDTPIYAAHCLNISKKTFYKPIIKHILECIVVCSVSYLYYCNTTRATCWGGIIAKTIECLTIVVIIIAVEILIRKVVSYDYKN